MEEERRQSGEYLHCVSASAMYTDIDEDSHKYYVTLNKCFSNYETCPLANPILVVYFPKMAQ